MKRLRGAVLAIELDEQRFEAVEGVVSRGSVQVRQRISGQRPEGVDPSDTSAYGTWLRTALAEAGVHRVRAIIALPRDAVVLKSIHFPGMRAQEAGPSGSAGDLAGMVRLQMARQLTMTLEGTSIDFVPIRDEEGTDSSAAGANVLAGALPGDRLSWIRSVCRSARLRISQIDLLSAGSAALLADVSQRRGGAVLGVWLGHAAVEFVVVLDGRLVFSRAAEIESGMDAEALASRVTVEAKRTWMSYRLGRDTGEIDSLVVLGQDDLARAVGARCGEALEMSWEVLGLTERVESAAVLDQADRARAAPLIGLLVQAGAGARGLDFAHPRRGPDPGAVIRQRSLAAALILLLVVGPAWVHLSGRLSALESRRSSARDEAAGVQKEYIAFLRDQARLEHLRRWTGTRADWLAHLRYINSLAPEPGQILLDQVRASLTASVEFEPRSSSGRRYYDGGRWRTGQQVAISISGGARDRHVSSDLRGRLVESGVYDVLSRGADVEDRFDLELVSSESAPNAAGNAGAEDSAADEDRDEPDTGATPGGEP